MTMRMILRVFVVAVTPWVPAWAESDQQTILFGQSAALTGPARELGIGRRLGLLAAFSEINREGGIHDYRLRLESLDDRYEPEAALANARDLIERYKVFALIGAVGTPTSKSAEPVASEAGVPYIAPFTGALEIRNGQQVRSDVEIRGRSLLHSVPLTAEAFKRSFLGEFGQYAVTVGLALFAFSTAIAWSYYGDRGMTFLFGTRSVMPYRVLYVVGVFLATVVDTSLVWLISAVTLALMTLPNLLGLMLMHKEVKALTQAYWTKFKGR